MRRALALASAAVGSALLWFWPRSAAATPSSSPAPDAAAPEKLASFATPLGLAELFVRAPVRSSGEDAGDERATGGGASLMPTSDYERAPVSTGPVPHLTIPPNAGESPQPPPLAIYQRFPLLIDAFVRDINASAIGLRVGLNSWWRSVDSGIGEVIGQHNLGLAIDFQGPDQELLVTRLKGKGFIVLSQSNAGVPYNHRHAQRERAGYLARLGVDVDTLRRWEAVG